MISLLAMLTVRHSANAQEITITLNPGWNWISYPRADTLGITEAMGSFIPLEGDLLESHNYGSMYEDDEWFGDCQLFYPGQGYMYYSNRNTPVTFNFQMQQPVSSVVVTTGQTFDITAESATISGEVTLLTDTHVFMRGVCWGTTSDPDIDGSYFLDGAGEGPFNVTLDELTPNTTYYVCAYAVSDHGLAYGEELSFTTLDNGGGGNHAYVDLGLPSGLLWATCNVGADNPEDYGDYFAWGETTTKSTYDWSTYQYCMGSSSTLTKYCSNSSYGYNGFTDNLTTLLPEDDAATANWGEGWRMPTQAEWQELKNNTTVTWTTQNGVNGRLFTASNGNSLFLPAAGYRYESSLDDAGSSGDYWSSSLNSDYPYRARRFYLYWDICSMFDSNRSLGHSVRPVRSCQNTTPTGAINGLFSVSANQQVYFSQGNLQYQASTDTWQFADNQWDMIGSENSNISENYSGWIDLFGWGTSGYNHGANCYQPWSTSTSSSDYYAYGNYQYNLYDQTGQADWGYNPISNGGNQANQWHTLTQAEWSYVFNTRSTTSGIRYAKANVNNVNGVILLPDDWSSSTYSLSNTNTYDASYSSNTLTASQWTILESAGAVFLPAAGYRNGTFYFVGSYGVYWSASYDGRSRACVVDFGDSGLGTNYGYDRYDGQSVRLVCPAE